MCYCLNILINESIIIGLSHLIKGVAARDKISIISKKYI